MSVPRGAAALERLRSLLDQPRPDAPYAETEPLPAGLGTDPPRPWLWDAEADPPVRPGLRDPQAYVLTEPGSALADALHRPPNEVLTGTGALDDTQQAYCRRSLDVTMKGGTTSGVVCPLALCELARRFRLRNVGGASAGAIAASLAAAAEHGRTRWDAAGRPALPAPEGTARRQGRLRPGFVGLADATAWFSQVDDPGPDQYRVAQLFRPTEAARPIFRLVVAAMRSRWVPFGALLLWSFGLRSRVLTAAVLLLAPLLAIMGTPAVAALGPVPAWGFAALVLALTTVAVICVVAALVGGLAWLGGREQTPPELTEPVTPRPDARPPGWWRPGLVALAPIAVIAVLVGRPTWSLVGGWRLAGAWLALLVAVVVIVVLSVLRVVGSAKGQKFGLVSGAVGPTTFRAAGRGRVWDAVAGLTPATLDRALVPWLDAAFADLAGTPGEVLRFGHLWLGPDYVAPGGDRSPELLERLAVAARTPRCRAVNLELMTTELVHGVSCRFPLRPNEDGRPVDTLLLRRSDLERAGAEVFPPAVVDALCVPGTAYAGPLHDLETGEPVDDLYPLPDPGDLPVVFATRLSLALPGLFQAVRVYRLAAGGGSVRDEYGVRIQRDGADLRYPEGQRSWVEELWFSDGGITSNFPIHLFDTPLPLWPTVGVNLGSHPRGEGHQDVWLPTPSYAGRSPARAQRGGLLGFAGSVVGTALSWSDTGQTFMPAFRGRVAWVRQRSDEGGNNLFMTSATIASLALRGALAGHRIAGRYGSDAHWQVHQWLRLRVALDNLAALHDRVGRAARTPPYVSLRSAETLDRLKEALEVVGTDPDPVEWFDPDPGAEFFAETQALLDRYADGPLELAALRRGVPQPAAELRQVPPG